MKECSQCHEAKSRDEFYPDKRRKDGLRRDCKACARAAVKRYTANQPASVRSRQQQEEAENLYNHGRRWRAANQERHNARLREWRKNNPAKVILSKAASRCRQQGNPSITFTDEQLRAKVSYWGDRCWICHTDRWNAIDHVKPLYRRGWNALFNLRPICLSCNSRKGRKWPFPTNPDLAYKALYGQGRPALEPDDEAETA